MNLSAVWQGWAALTVALAGLLVPLLIGGLLAWLMPGWWGIPLQGMPNLFAVFFGTALAISALPVVPRSCSTWTCSGPISACWFSWRPR